MGKMQVKEMRDFSSQKITYEKISAILQAIYSSMRRYSVKSFKLKSDFAKKWNFSQDLSSSCGNNDF